MVPLVNDRFKFIFYYNPKSACSVYRTLFLELHRNELPENVRSVVTVHNIGRYCQPTKGSSYDDYYKYAIVRNPYARIASAYVDKCFQYKYPPKIRYKNESFMNSIFQRVFAFLDRPIDFKKGFSFHELLDYLHFSYTNKRPVDIHFSRQSFPIVELNSFYRLEDDISQLETIFTNIYKNDDSFLAHSLEQLQRTSGKVVNATFKFAPSKDASEIATTQRKYFKYIGDANFEELEEIKQQGYVFDYSAFYDQKIKQQVASIFARDIKTYKYPFPY